jgi:hypothetical protein
MSLILVYEAGRRIKSGKKFIPFGQDESKLISGGDRMEKKQELPKEFSMKIVKAANKASKELGSIKNKKPHK